MIEQRNMAWRVRNRVPVSVVIILLVLASFGGYFVGYKRAQLRESHRTRGTLSVERHKVLDVKQEDGKAEVEVEHEQGAVQKSVFSPMWEEEWAKLPSILKSGEKDCDKMYPSRELANFDYQFYTSWQEYINFFTEKYVNRGVEVEGHIGNILYQTQAYYRLARLKFVRTVCEIGFNGGHSAFLWLSASERTTLYSFDLGEHVYTKQMASYLEEKFPDRFHISYGDSTKTVPSFLKKNPDVKCDLLVVDGGHTYPVAKADLENMMALANRENNIVIFDDYPSKMLDFMIVLGRAWEEMKEQKKIDEIFSCSAGYTGFTVGTYLF